MRFSRVVNIAGLVGVERPLTQEARNDDKNTKDCHCTNCEKFDIEIRLLPKSDRILTDSAMSRQFIEPVHPLPQ